MQELPFGRQVRERRRALDLTQEELARRVGCAAITIRKIEAEAMRASQQVAERLAISLAVVPDERPAFIRAARSIAPAGQEPRSPATPAAPSAFLPEEVGVVDLSGRAIRGYQLGERLGSGGFGAVYRAVQPLIEREVAVKIILPQYADQPDFIRRFETEAQLVARLEHPHIVPLYDYWREPGVAYLVMRLLRGGSLHGLLQQGPPRLTYTCRLVEQLGAALQVAHRAGVVHRDLKPANVLLDEEGNAYLADFGIAKDLHQPTALSFVGAFVGSPAYSSPEQIRAEPITAQADIYALGVLLFELLTGQKPFAGPTPAALIQQHLTALLPPLGERRTDLPPALDQIIQRATAKVPAARYTSVAELVAELRGIIGEPAPAPPLPAPALVSAAPPTLAFDLLEIDNPYQGLRPFGEANAGLFFGRESLVQQLLARMGEAGELARFLAVVGPSGSGKSSVVRAGLIPALRRGGLPGSEHWYVVDLLPGADPLGELAAALSRVASTGVDLDALRALVGADSRGLLRATRLVLPANAEVELVLLIDQFEELFTLCADEATRAQFLDSLVVATLDDRSRLRVVITLRADFIDRPLQYVDFGELLRQRSELVLPLNPDELEQAIMGPARHAGLALDAGLAAALVADGGAQPGALPLLQHALSELFVRREGRLLRRAAYVAIGGVAGALAQSAEQTYAGLDAASQAAARQLFLRLTTPGEGGEDARRRARRDELLALAAPMDRAIDTFGRARLLTFDHDPAGRAPTVEVAHEALLRAWPRLRGWLDAARADLHVQRRLAQEADEWQRHAQAADYLATGVRLAQYAALDQGGAVALSASEHGYLAASQVAQAAREQAEADRQSRELAQARALAEEQRARAEEQSSAGRRLRTRAWMLAGALALMAVAALFAGSFAVRNADLAVQNANVAETAQAAGNQAIAQGATAEAARRQAVAAQATAQVARDQAEQESRIAASRAFAASALNNLASDAERSTLLSIHALNQADTPEAEDALHQALLASRVRRTLTGHTGSVNGVDFSPDGLLLASAADDGTTKIWDALTGRELSALTGHSGPIGRVAFSPDGRYLATAGADASVKLWEVANAQEIRSFIGHTDSVTDLSFGRDGRQLFTVSSDGTLKTWEVATGQELRSIAGLGGIYGLALSPDGSRIAAGLGDGPIAVWDAGTGEQIDTLTGVPLTLVGSSSAPTLATVIALAFSPDNTRLAAATFDGSAAVFNLTDQRILFWMNTHTSALSDVIFSADGMRVITASQDGTARVWDANTGRALFTIVGHLGAGSINDIVIAPGCVDATEAPFAWCGQTLATASRDGTVKLWDISPTGGRELMVLPGFVASYSTDGAQLITATYSNDDLARITHWDPAKCVDTPTCRPSTPPLFTAGGTPETFTPSTAGSVLGLAFSPDGAWLAKGGADGTVVVWQTATGAVHLSLSAFADRVESLVFSPDGARLAAASLDGRATIWDVRSGVAQLTIQGHDGQELVGIAFSADGRYLATGGGDTTAKVWDATTGAAIQTFSGHTQAVVPVAFSPDGRLLATGSRDGTARLWEIATGTELLTLRGHTASLRSVAFSPDGRLLATGSGDATTRVWDISDGPQLGQSLLVLRGHTASVRSLSFSPDGRFLAAGSRDGTVQIYVLDSADLVALARRRLTRSWTPEECRQYLQLAECPAGP